MKKCTSCGSEKLRAHTEETARVVIDDDGRVLDVFDFESDGVDLSSVYCQECGENVDVFSDEKKA